MYLLGCWFFIALFAMCPPSSRCRPGPVEEGSVVSIYTTPASPANTTHPLDVYHLIASNIAERITTPIYKFFGINATTQPQMEAKKNIAKNWKQVELLDSSPEDNTKLNMRPVDNDISKSREVEELDKQVVIKTDKKPEKIVKDNNNSDNGERNETLNEVYVSNEGKKEQANSVKKDAIAEKKEVNGTETKDISTNVIGGSNTTSTDLEQDNKTTTNENIDMTDPKSEEKVPEIEIENRSQSVEADVKAVDKNNSTVKNNDSKSLNSTVPEVKSNNPDNKPDDDEDDDDSEFEFEEDEDPAPNSPLSRFWQFVLSFFHLAVNAVMSLFRINHSS